MSPEWCAIETATGNNYVSIRRAPSCAGDKSEFFLEWFCHFEEICLMDMSGDNFAPNFDIVAETRRRWSLKEKRSIVAEASGFCTNISVVARRHGIKPALLYRWKKELGGDQAVPSSCGFVPVSIAAPTVEPAGQSTPMPGR